MAYAPPDPSQPLPEEPDTQDLEDEYANVRDALAGDISTYHAKTVRKKCVERQP